MPASDPMSRGKSRNFKNLQKEFEPGEGKQVLVSEIVTPSELMELLDDLHKEGIGLSISRTRDGGAIAWGFLMGGKPVMKYTPTRGAWEDLLKSLA